MYLAVIFGGLIFLSFALNKAGVRKDFKWYKFLRKNGVQTILNILSGVVIIWLYQNEPDSLIFEKILGDLDLTKCLFLGVFGQAILTGVVHLLNKNTKTKLGINKKK